MDTQADTVGFGALNFAGARLGDQRRTKRLVQSADALLAHPGGTLPEKLGNPAAQKGVYHLAQCEQVTHASVLTPHLELTRQRIAAATSQVLNLHDSTELDFTSKTSLKDLGHVGKGRNSRGYIAHHSLAVVAGSRDVLGLTSQILHRRVLRDGDETRAQLRECPDRESRLWQRGCEALEAARPVVDIADRGADLFEFLDFEHRTGRRYVVRSKSDRQCEIDGPEGPQTVRLHGYARQLEACGHYTLEIPARDKRPARTARVRVAASAVRLLPPRVRRGEHGDDPLASVVVYVGEQEPPEGVEPLEWILLTNVPADSLGQARERADWYSHRWIIEEFHKAQKTGCGIEKLQFTSTERLEPMIALLSVVSVEMVRLRDAARNEETADRPAQEYVPALYVTVLSAWRWSQIREMTVKEFYMALARLGGHQNRKSDHPPGWQVLWRGRTKLESMVAGVAALEAARSG